MSLKLVILFAGVVGILGLAAGYYLRFLISLGKRGSVDLKVKQMELKAQEDAKKVIESSEKKARQMVEEARKTKKEKETEFKKTENRLIKKEEFLDKRQADIDTQVDEIKKKIEEVRKVKESTQALEEEKRKELERVAKISTEEAKKELLDALEKQYEEDFLVRSRKLETSGVERLEQKAKEILTTAIHRLGNSVAADVLTTSVVIPNEEIKGKIIGKEGRNIRAFERAAGVELIVDDTPGAVI